jgi:hypothetical protein
MPDVPTTIQTLPPLAEPPTPERIRELSGLVTLVAFELEGLREELGTLGEKGYGAAECKRHAELEKKGDLTAEERDELAVIEACLARAQERDPVLSYELAGLLAIVCREAARDADKITQEAEKILDRLHELTGYGELPAGGWRQVDEERVAMFERRAAEARRRLDGEPV